MAVFGGPSVAIIEIRVVRVNLTQVVLRRQQDCIESEGNIINITFFEST